MDVEQYKTPDRNDAADGEVRGDIVRASEILPALIPVLPQERRPFFPGQMIPLVISGEWEDTLKKAVDSEQKILGLHLVRGDSSSESRPSDFYAMGTACRVHRVVRSDEGHLQVLLEGIQRYRAEEWVSSEAPYSARVRYFPETAYGDDPEIKAYAVAIINTIRELLPLNPLYGEELKVFLDHFSPNEPARLADFAASLTTASKQELQEVLEATVLMQRIQKVLLLIRKELDVAQAQARIQAQVEQEIQGRQREVILREQLKAIQHELGITKDDRTAEQDRFSQRIADKQLPDKVRVRVEEEMEKFSLLETGSPEYAVTRNYLDWLTSLPWGTYSQDKLDLDEARKILDQDHEGLEDVKQRIIEFIGVGAMKGDVSGSILLLVGPPGVGKTSLGRSIARALGREFFRFSLGGMRDEAEIKGHRRTYIGALPGKFIQAIKETGTGNPVIMLDEIDKIGASFQGDPASALLEVLDPEQNMSFHDHYLDVPFDLSRVLFICTANQLDTIPGPLLDRTEVIRLSGYLAREKLDIAEKHLLPRILKRAGVSRRQIRIGRRAIRAIIDGYAREAGVRRLEKQLGRITRKAVVKLLEGHDTPLVVSATDIESYLGKPTFRPERLARGVGLVTGLAWTAMGGATLTIEAARIHQYGRGFRLTGQLGNVMQESAGIAYSHVLANREKYQIPKEFFKDTEIHLHVPAGATPKDGPSAGITMATALISLARGQPLKAGLAMTGELTLTGQVLPVGGIREKLVAARRAGIKTILLPSGNRGDYEEVPDYVRKGITVNFVSEFSEVLSQVFARTAA